MSAANKKVSKLALAAFTVAAALTVSSGALAHTRHHQPRHHHRVHRESLHAAFKACLLQSVEAYKFPVIPSLTKASLPIVLDAVDESMRKAQVDCERLRPHHGLSKA